MTKLTRLILFLVFPVVGRLSAQVAGPTPLVDPQTVTATVPGGWIVAEASATAALQAGFATTAATIFQEILLDPVLPGEARQRVILMRVTALLDHGALAEAEKQLQAYEGPRDSAYQLRAGLLAVNARRIPQARAALAAGRAEDLYAADRGWWYFLQAAVADFDNDIERRNRAFEEASRAAVSDLQRARIAIVQEQARLRAGPLSEVQMKALRENMERFQGTRTGYDAMRTYAAALAGLGRAAEAQTLLQRQLAVIPASEKNVIDQLRLVLGLIAGEGSAAGQQAFRQLLREGQRPETQRLALQLLAHGAKTPAERTQLRRDLTALISAEKTHPIIEDLLLVRAQTALADKAYAAAEEDARALLERYPNSSLKAAALSVRLSVAWEGKRYRTAADVIAQLRLGMIEGRERAELGVLLAETFFRAEDYKNAADAYDAALRERPEVVQAGILIFQRVLSLIRANDLPAAIIQLDQSAANPAFGAVYRWQAEWNLVKEMQIAGQSQAAYGRVNRLLEEPAQGVPEELRIRLLWLRAKLSYDNNDPAATLRQSDDLLAVLQNNPGLDAPLKAEMTATTQLLRAQGMLALKQDREGFATLDKLRADFRTSKAAQYSYLVQAGYLMDRGDLAGAQSVLVNFVDNDDYRRSEYAPLALYEAALNLERQGLDRQLGEANKQLERLISEYRDDELVFAARLKQGDLFRKLNDFPAARRAYESLVNSYATHPDVLLARLALADTIFAQGVNSPANYETGAAMFERLRDLPSAPVDLRAEAGFKWGYALAKRSQSGATPPEREQQNGRAKTIFWSVVNAFLLDPTQAAKLGATGRYWVTRSLLELGQMQEESGNIDEAQRAYQLIIDRKLGASGLAQTKLQRYRSGASAAP